MKRGNVLSALMMTTFFCGWMLVLPGALEAQEQGQAQQESPWKDRAEYDAFNAMAQATDPNQRIELADKYLGEYPETKFGDKVLEFKLQAYQQLNNSELIQETATKLLEVKPDHFHALYLLSYLLPRTINVQDASMSQKLDRAAGYARRGLQEVGNLPQPEGVSAADFQKQKDQATAVFHQTAGFVALQKKNYSQAEQELHRSAEMNPADSLGFYWLGLAYLTPQPAKHDLGMWALARAVSITGPSALPPATKTTVQKYLGDVYDARHGSTEGLDEVLAQAASSPFPPPDFHVMTVQESPEYIAQQEALRQEELRQEELRQEALAREALIAELTTFDVIAEYLAGGGEKAAATWEVLEGQNLELPGRVVGDYAVDSRSIRLAVSPAVMGVEGKHDLEVTLSSPLTEPLKRNTDIKVDGKLDSYTSRPFLIRFINGKITSR